MYKMAMTVIVVASIQERYYFYFSNKEIEAQRGEVICPKPWSFIWSQIMKPFPAPTPMLRITPLYYTPFHFLATLKTKTKQKSNEKTHPQTKEKQLNASKQ